MRPNSNSLFDDNNQIRTVYNEKPSIANPQDRLRNFFENIDAYKKPNKKLIYPKEEVKEDNLLGKR